MAAIHDLIAQIGDARLRDRLAAEWSKATRERKFGRIQLICKRSAPGGAEQFVRLDINRTETIQKLLLIDKPAQLDALFDGVI